MKWVLMIVSLLLFATVPAFAQTPDIPPAPIPGSEWFGNAAAISAATVLLVAGLKRSLANVSGLADIPTWMYAIAVSVALTFVARNVFGTMQGPLVPTLMSAAVSAAVASGAREWFTSGNATKTLRASAITAGVSGVEPKGRL